MLKELKLVEFNPWDVIECPFCGSRSFVTIHHSGVFCEECNAQFSARDTGGDYGIVIDVEWDFIYMPAVKNSDLLKYRHISRVIKPGNYDSGWMGFTDGEVANLTEGLSDEELEKLLHIKQTVFN